MGKVISGQFLSLNSHKIGALFLIALLLSTTCTVNPDPQSKVNTSPTFTATRHNKLGVHLLLSDGKHDWPPERWSQHLQYARQAVGEGGYVLELVRLDDLDVKRWQHFMDLCAQHHLTPMLRLATTHRPSGGWSSPPRDADGAYGPVAAQYAAFVAALDWPTDKHYVIVGNEPNHGGEWGGRVDPAAYARFLIDVADALHQSDPQVQVLNAGFDPYSPHTGSQPFADGQYYMDEETFLDQMVAAYPDVFTHLDAWSSHAYPLGPFIEGPWQQDYGVDWLNEATNPQHIDPPPNIYNRGINGYEWELFKLSTYNIPPLPVFITETGWRHAESVDPNSPDNGGSLPQAESVARYLDLALHGNQGRYPELPQNGWTPWLNEARVKGVILFAFDGHPAYWGHTNLLQLDEQGRVGGVYAPFNVLKDVNRQK